MIVETLRRSDVRSWPGEALASAAIRYVEDGRTYEIGQSHRLAWNWLNSEDDEYDLAELRCQAAAVVGSWDESTERAVLATAVVVVRAPERTAGRWGEVRS